MICFDDRFMNPNPVARAIDYAQYVLWETGVNWLALGMHRRSTMSIFMEYASKHPFQFYFRDQMLSQIALLIGQVKGFVTASCITGIVAPKKRRRIWKAVRVPNRYGPRPWLYFYYDYWLACEYASLYLYRGYPMLSSPTASAMRIGSSPKCLIDIAQTTPHVPVSTKIISKKWAYGAQCTMCSIIPRRSLVCVD